MSQTAVNILRDYLKFARNWFEGTMKGVDSDLAHWQPPGNTQSIAANYIHVLTTEDYVVNALIQGKAPLMASTFAGKSGFNEAPPVGIRDDWAKNVRVDLDAARAYAQAIYAATDDYLASITDEDLSRDIDASAVGFGHKPLSFIVGLALLNMHNHCGEISCIKGLKELQGYPR